MKTRFLRSNFSFRSMAVIACIGTISFLNSCKKNSSDVANELPALKTDVTTGKMGKLVNYLSKTLGVSKDVIEFDEKTSEFFVPNTVFRSTYAEIESRYDQANEFKLNYE